MPRKNQESGHHLKFYNLITEQLLNASSNYSQLKTKTIYLKLSSLYILEDCFTSIAMCGKIDSKLTLNNLLNKTTQKFFYPILILFFGKT